jgi:group I intron endonuclease
MRVAYIYCITNTVNQKQYIGKTTQNNPYTRFEQHIQAARHKKNTAGDRSTRTMPIVSAIRKYGEDKFKFDVVEKCTEDNVNERESHFIREYNTADGNGYNCTYGGEGASKPQKYWGNHPFSKPVSCYTLEGEWMRDFDSIGLGAAYALNRKPTHSERNCIRVCINGGTFQALGYRWALKGEQPKCEEKRVNRRGKVYGIHPESGQKKMWKSAADVAEQLNGNRRSNQSINSALDRNVEGADTMVQVKGWYLFRDKHVALSDWKKAERFILSSDQAKRMSDIINEKRRRPIYGVNINTGEKHHFNSISEASFFVKGEGNYTATSCIIRNIRRLKEGLGESYAYNYRWYEDN